METISRKRLRSEENPFELQSKIFVSQQRIDSRSNEKMNRIHNKTINMLFNGVRNLENNNPKVLNPHEISQLVKLSGSGNLVFLSKDKPKGYFEEKSKSKCCGKDVFVIADCLNCNLGLCEYCASSCVGCRGFLCESCIMLFECGTAEQPICQPCKMFH